MGGSPEFYALAYGRTSFHAYPGSRWEYALTRDLVCGTRGTVLEVGAGDGAFQRDLLSAGVSPSRLFATEYSADCVHKLRALGIEATNEDFRNLPPADHTVLCAHQVMEHLGDLDAIFAAFDSLTARNGVVALSVPNGVHTFRTEAADGELDMPPNHVSTWQYSALNAAARRRRWVIADYREEPLSRSESAKNLAISRTFRSRQMPRSLTTRLERLAPTARIRHGLMALSAASRLPSTLLSANEGFGGSLWVVLRRA